MMRALWPWVYACFIMLHVRIAFASIPPVVKLDLWDAPWKNMVAAVLTALIGGSWAFLRRIANDDVPKTRSRWIASLVADLLAAVIVGLGVLFYAEMQSWTYGATMLALLVCGVGASLIVERWRRKGVDPAGPVI